MSANRTRQTATILPFTGRVRLDRLDGRKHAERTPASPAAPAMTFGAGWYHDAAIREADPDRKG